MDSEWSFMPDCQQLPLDLCQNKNNWDIFNILTWKLQIKAKDNNVNLQNIKHFIKSIEDRGLDRDTVELGMYIFLNKIT